MIITDKIELRLLQKRTWIKPEAGLRKLQMLNCFSQILPKAGGSKSWRKEPFKKYFEEFQAALFSYGLQQHFPIYRWEYSYGAARTERKSSQSPSDQESDYFIRCKLPPKDGGLVYKPIQLKELVSENRNSQSSLQRLIEKIAKKYTALPDQEILVVAIYINRATTIRFQELRIPKMRVEQLWFYGFTDNANCFIVGNLLGNPARHNFAYPHFQIESPVSETPSRSVRTNFTKRVT